MSTRGWTISDGSRTIDSLDIEKTGILCYDEPNIDSKSFNNEYLFSEDTQEYSLNQSYPNQVTFTLKFLIHGDKWGDAAAQALVDLKSFFDQGGTEFVIVRNIYGYKNRFVVDAIDGSHFHGKDDFVRFEVTGSYVGDFRDYEVVRERVIFDGEVESFTFDHYFDMPEPSTVFDNSIIDEYIKTLNNKTGKMEGLLYSIKPLTSIDSIKITNVTYDEVFKIDYAFQAGDQIIFDTESEEPVFTMLRSGVTTNLLQYVDFSVSSLPMLYAGPNVIRIDLYYNGAPVAESNTYAAFWNRKSGT